MQLENSINHRYIIRRKIGQGGMGAVYEAYDRLMQRTVALKTVLRQPIFNNSLSKTIQIDATTHDVTIADQPSIGESLLPLANEFQILATLRHPHIISVHDYGFDTQQNPYFTMDFLKTGVPMDTYCALASDDSKIRVLTEILQALIYLHRRQVLHCDLKPDNVIVTDDQVKVLDFGLSSLRSGADSSGGTLAYMAPELLQGGEVSIQSDLYAVGVIGFEMLSGLLPFDPDESSFFEDVLWHEADYFFVDAPEPVSSVLAKLMAKRPEDRYRSAEAALAALCRAAGQPIPAETTRIRESFLQNAVFVGRELERSKIQEILAAVKSGFNQTPSLLIGGESGVGKSRLIQECKTRALVTGLHVYEGQAQKDDGSGFVLWESIIERVILTYDISPDQLPVLKQIAPRIENMLGQTIPDPAPIPPDLANERLTRTILDLFGRINEPTLLILEDLQWYPDDVDIFERLLSLSELRHNLAIIGTYRNDEAPDLPTKLPLMESIILDRFSPIDIAALSQSMLGDVGLRPEIQKMLMAESEGNVFFLVEIVRALAEIAGQINSIGVDSLPEKLLPKGILSIVENRLQQVPEALHGILKFSSVAGREIDVDLIKNYLVTARADCSVDEFLMVAANAAFFELYNEQWRFSHDKLRQGVLSTIKAGTLPDWHQQVALGLEVTYPTSPAIAHKLADHWRAAGYDLKDQHYSIQAADYFKGVYKMDAALQYVNRALAMDHLQNQSSMILALLLRESLYSTAGKRDLQEADIEALEALGADMANTLLLRARLSTVLGDYQEVVNHANALLGEEDGNASGPIDRVKEEAHLLKGEALIRLGHHESGVNWLQRSLNGWLQDQKVSAAETEMTYLVGLSLSEQGQYSQSHEYHQRALTYYRKLDDRLGEAKALSGIGVLYYNQMEWSKSIAHYEQARKILEEIGDAEGQAKLLTNLYGNSSAVARYEEAIKYAEKALQLSININSLPGKVFNLTNLMCTYCDMGNWEMCSIYREILKVMLKEIDNLFFQAFLYHDIGSTYLVEGDLDEAQTYFQNALDVSHQIDDEPLIIQSIIPLAEIMRQQGDAAGAIALFKPLLEDQGAGIWEELRESILLILCTIRLFNLIDTDQSRMIIEHALGVIHGRKAELESVERWEYWLSNTPGAHEILELAKTDDSGKQ